EEGSAEQERDAPTPAEELIVRQERDDREDTGGSEESGGSAQLVEATCETSTAFGGVLEGEQGATSILAADADPLHEAQEDEQHRSEASRHRVRGEQAHGESASADQKDGDQQNWFPPDAVAEVSEDDRAERPGQERHGEGAEGLEERDCRRGASEEDMGEHECGGGSVDPEVVPLEKGPCEGCEGGPA